MNFTDRKASQPFAGQVQLFVALQSCLCCRQPLMCPVAWPNTRRYAVSDCVCHVQLLLATLALFLLFSRWEVLLQSWLRSHAASTAAVPSPQAGCDPPHPHSDPKHCSTCTCFMALQGVLIGNGFQCSVCCGTVLDVGNPTLGWPVSNAITFRCSVVGDKCSLGH